MVLKNSMQKEKEKEKRREKLANHDGTINEYAD